MVLNQETEIPLGVLDVDIDGLQNKEDIFAVLGVKDTLEDIMRSKLFLFLLLGLFLMSFASALEFDNVLNYDETQEEIVVTNLFNLGADLIKATLQENGCDENMRYCQATLPITLYESGKLIEGRQFFTVKGEEKYLQDIRQSYLEYWGNIDDFETRCIDGETIYNETSSYIPQICEQVKTGTHEGWISFTEEDEFNAGDYLVKFSGEKKPSRIVDWQIKIKGKWTTPWAIWGNISLGDEAEVILNSPTDASIQYTNLVTTNSTATVSGGATLVNVSFYDNSTGTWETRNTTTLTLELLNESLTEYANNSNTAPSIKKTFIYSTPINVTTSNNTLCGATNFGFTINVLYQYIYEDDTKQNSSTQSHNIDNICASYTYANPNLAKLVKKINVWAWQTSWNPTYPCSFKEDRVFGYNIIPNNIVFNNTYSAGQTILWNMQFCDSDGDCGFATLNRTFSIDSVAPTIEIINNSIVMNVSTNHTINYTITDTNLNSCWLNYNNTNRTIPCTSGAINTTNFTLNLNQLNFTLWANDSVGNYNNSMFDITLDSTIPTITLNYPTALVDYGKVNGTLQLNFTATDTNLDKVWYNYNGTNITIAGALTGVYNLSNITLSTKKNVTIYANDSIGNLNTSVFSWDYKVFENSFTFNNETRAGDIEDFILNLTLHSSVDLTSAILFYEGTPNYPSISSVGQFRIISLLNYAVPLYTVDTNASLFFNLILDDTTEINTTNVTQLVQAIFLDNCSTYTNRLFNISLFDEITKVSMRGDIEFVYKLLNVPAYQQINKLNMSFTNVSNISICSDINLSEQNFVQSIEIRYTSDGYKSEFYNIQRAEITDENIVINLFDLNSSSSTEFKVTYQDSSFDFVEDAIVQLQRKYIAEDIYEVVEAPLTSSDGVVLLHIDINSVKYRATITKNGVLLDEFDNLVFKCQSELTGECEYKLLGNINPQNDLNYDNTTDFYYSEPVLTNESITLTFSVPSGTPGLINLVMTQTDQFANKTLCNKTITSSSGSLTCDYSVSLGESYIDLYLYKDGEGVVRTTYILYPESELTWLGNNYIFIIILLFSLVGMALSSPEWIIINGIITIVISGGLWLANGLSFVMGLGNIIWLVIAGIILISKISQQEDR